MASNTETGHAKLVANFKTLINACTGMGTVYQPSKDALKLTALNPQYLACKAANTAVKVPLVNYKSAVADRKALYKPLNKLVTRLYSIFKGTDALPGEKAFAKTTADKIRGTQNKPPKVENEDTHSTSQQSYVMRADNFETLIAILEAEPTYMPAEPELQVATLKTMLASMGTLNDAAELAYKALRNVRIARNTALYGVGTGLVDTALAVKDYVKGAVGTGNSQFKDISGLEFKRLEEDPNK